MKTAVSIPDDVFEGAERLARRTKKSPEEVTEAMDRVCADLVETKDVFVSSAARRTLRRSEW